MDFLAHIQANGIPGNPEAYKKLHGYENLYEFKRKPHRLLFFKRAVDEIVFTEAFRKSDTRKDDLHMQRADRRRQEYEHQEKAKRGE